MSEALTLSASIFNASIDAWLPADFGVSKPESSKQKDWETALRTSRGERLGLGHPDLADPTARARAASQRAGIELLNRKLKRRKEENEEFLPRVEESDDDEERRGSTKKAKRKRAADPFAKAGGKVMVHPLLDLRRPIPGYDAPRGVEGAEATEGVRVEEKVEGGSQLEALRLVKPTEGEVKSKKAKVENAAAGSKSGSAPAPAPVPTPAPVPESAAAPPQQLSKTQLRHLKRKQQKARAKAATATGPQGKLKATSKL